MIRLIVTAVLATSLAACAAPKPPAGGPTTGQALAASNCPYRIAQADAWINLMPGPVGAPRDMHVAIQLVTATDTALVIRSEASTPDELVLDLRGADNTAQPGRISYREPAKEPPKRISIRCRGAEIHAITSIEKVY
jgi:hypothetical protein